MDGVILSFGIEKLCVFLSQKCKDVYEVKAQVPELITKLQKLKSFMIDADAKTHSNSVRSSLEEIKEIIYDAENIFEAFIVRDQLERSGGIMECIRWLFFFFPNRMKIASEMKDISTRISTVIADMQNFGVIEKMICDGSEYSRPRQEGLRSSMRQEFPGECESHFVGLEENVEKLVGYLVEEDDIQVVSVTGMGGLGKTTLARQVFNHDKVKNKFNRFAWVCVTQEFDYISVWKTILKNFRTKEEEDKIMRMEVNTLQGELFQLLGTSKSLIVIDDIWKPEHWDMLRKIFPKKKGLKVLLTSRNENVVGHGYTLKKFELKCLTNQESWTLFQKIAFSREDASELKIDEEMETMAKQMVKHCGGLPFAVRVLGSLLAEKPHDWRRISDDIGSHILRERIDENNSPLYHVLSLSFAELPRSLQYCFLYLAHFPEDYIIDVEELSYYWATEGILEHMHYDGESIRDVGESCIEELVRRNMVISERDVMTLRFETCQLHDMMREVCLSKAKEENFLHFLGIPSQTAHSQSSTTARRVVSQMPTTLHVEIDINNPKIRSLVVVRRRSRSSFWGLSILSFTWLPLLRVLHIPSVGFGDMKVPSSIGELIHLRYLNLEYAMVHIIPSSLGNLKLLIYLNIDIYSLDPTFVPNVFMGMKDLRYLALPFYMDEKTKLELSNLVDLETLINFSTDNISLEDLHDMSRLRTLRIKLTGERSLQILSASIRGLRHLENLDIHYNEAKSLKEVDGTTLNFKNLKQLKLRILHALPDELNLPSRLTSLTLDYGCNWKEDPMPILEKLRHLKEVCLVESFSSKKMVCSTGGFPQLQKLKLWALNEWEEWIVEEGSMPLLHTLIILRCEKLKELSDGLRFITSLKYLEVSSEEEKWKERLSEGGEDYYKIQHIPSVKIQVLEDVKTILRGLFSDDKLLKELFDSRYG